MLMTYSRSCRFKLLDFYAKNYEFKGKWWYLRLPAYAATALMDSFPIFSKDFPAKRLELARDTAPNMVARTQTDNELFHCFATRFHVRKCYK